MRLPDINPSQGSLGQSQVIRQPNIVEGIGDGLGVFGEMKARKEESDANAWMAEQGANAEIEATRLIEEARLAGDPSKISDTFFKNLETSKDKYLASAPNNIAKEKFNTFYQNLRSNYGRSAIDTEVSETKQYRKVGIQRALDSYIANQNNLGYEATKQGIARAINSGVGSVYGGADAADLEYRYSKELAVNDVQIASESGNLADALKTLEVHKETLGDDYTALKSRLTGIGLVAEDVGSLASAVDNGLPATVKSPKAIKNYTNFVINPLLVDKNPEGINKTVNLVRATNSIPADVKNYVARSFSSNDKEQRIYSYNLVNNIEEQSANNYLVGKTFNKKILTEATHYKKLIDSGVPENDVFSILDRTYRNADDKITAKAKKDAVAFAESESLPTPRTIDKGLTISSPVYPEDITDVDEDILKLPDSTLAQEPLVEQTYKELLKEYYVLSQDEELAKTQAMKALREQVGMSKATGKATMMFYPPEKYYSIPHDPSGLWVKDSLAEDLKASYPEYNVDDTILIPDDITKAEIKQGLNPTYRLFGVKNNSFNDLGRVDFNAEIWDEKLRMAQTVEGENLIEKDKPLKTRYYFQQLNKALKNANNR